MEQLLKPYPAYKPTAIPWLQQVPQHWEVLPGLSHLRFKQEKNTGMVEKQVLSLSYGRIVIKPKEKLTGLVPESFETYQIVGPGDIIVRATDLQNDRTSLRIGEVKDRGIITSAYLCLNVHSGMVPSFGYYLIHAYDLMKVLYGFGSGLRQNLDWKDFKRMPLAVPPPAEQHLIVRYLHALDAKVKRYIRAKRSLIARLQEQKQAIIQRAVTRGLDPNVKLKTSGVEWLGEVPEHWEVKKLKRLGEVRIGLTYSPGDLTGEQGTLVLRASNIRYGRIVSADNVYVSKTVPEVLKVVEGDLLICVRSGSRSLVGKSAMIPKEYQGVSYGAFMSLLRSKDNDYIFWVLNSNMLPSVMAQFETSTINQLTQSDLRNLSIPMPPRDERALILKHLLSATAEVDSAVDIAQREISTLMEYHTRLIADVVTGAVDVRAAAQALPADQMISGSDDQMMEEESVEPELNEQAE